MFNENSAMQDVPAGQSEIRETRSPIVSVMDQSNTETPEPSLPAGATALAWWDDMKYFWKRNASGNGCHLAPQDSYIDDVLVEGDVEIQRAAKEFLNEKSDDYERAERVVKLVRELGQELTGFDPSGVEANALIRFFRERSIISRKIAGASAVSANHRLANAAATTGDIEAVKATDYFKSDIENTERWAYKDCLHEYVCTQLATEYPDVIQQFSQQLANGVKRALYDDAVEKGNKLKQPAPAKQASASKLTAEELRQMRA